MLITSVIGNGPSHSGQQNHGVDDPVTQKIEESTSEESSMTNKKLRVGIQSKQDRHRYKLQHEVKLDGERRIYGKGKFGRELYKNVRFRKHKGPNDKRFRKKVDVSGHLRDYTRRYEYISHNLEGEENDEFSFKQWTEENSDDIVHQTQMVQHKKE
ncbi:unnamed protein product [Trichobilharzia regenti]|nr:unnamed protein product [Trichobilharzia regenti]